MTNNSSTSVSTSTPARHVHIISKIAAFSESEQFTVRQKDSETFNPVSCFYAKGVTVKESPEMEYGFGCMTVLETADISSATSVELDGFRSVQLDIHEKVFIFKDDTKVSFVSELIGLDGRHLYAKL